MTGLELSAAARHVVLTEMSLAASLLRVADRDYRTYCRALVRRAEVREAVWRSNEALRERAVLTAEERRQRAKDYAKVEDASLWALSAGTKATESYRAALTAERTAFASLAALKGVIGKDLGGEEPVDVEAERCEAWARIEAAGELGKMQEADAVAK